MKKFIFTLFFLHLFIWEAISQQFAYHSNSPFGIQSSPTGAFAAVPTIQFYDYDGDGDQDLFFTGLDSIEDTPGNPGWEHLHFFLDMQENIGTPYAPQFGERTSLSAYFPYPVGYFFTGIGDLNFDGLTDFITTADIDFIGNQKLSLVTNTGQPGKDQFEVTTLESMLDEFVPESFFMPHLVDLDLDGDLDLLNSGFNPAFAVEDGPDESAIFYARNIGTKSEPNFQGWYPNPYGLKPDTIPELMTSGDIDLDGDIDFIGSLTDYPADSINAILVHLNNAGMDQRPVFDEILRSPFGLPSTQGDEQFWFPALVDLDGDGDLDLFVFRGSSSDFSLEYYINDLCLVTTQQVAYSICEGESLKYNGETYTEAGVFEFHFMNSQHCDSIVELTLTVEPLNTSFVQATICEGETYLLGVDTFYEAGDYTVLVQASNGCDTIVNLSLIVEPLSISVIDATICDGESYTIGGETFSASGNYIVVETAANGCDSIIQLSLTVEPLTGSSVEASICAGESYTLGGETFTNSGDYTVAFTGANGCDSIVMLSLQVIDVVAEVTLTDQTLTASWIGATYQWLDCDSGENIPGAVNQSFIVTATGNYAVVVTTPEGCSDQSDCINVTITSNDGWHEPGMISLVPNPANGAVYISNPGRWIIRSVTFFNTLGQVSQISKPDGAMALDISHLQPGTYLVQFEVDGKFRVSRLVVY